MISNNAWLQKGQLKRQALAGVGTGQGTLWEGSSMWGESWRKKVTDKRRERDRREMRMRWPSHLQDCQGGLQKQLEPGEWKGHQQRRQLRADRM
jgi:hypothetical protein